MLVLALGADYDVAATPGLAEAGNEFYSVAGAETLRDVLPTFRSGTAIVGVCGTPFKCPPAPSEAALLLDTFMRERGLRDDVHIRLVMPFGTPIPPSPDTSAAILSTFAERGIEFVPERTVISLDPATHEAVLDDGTRHPYDLFLGIPVHRAPAVVVPLTDDGWIAVDQHTLATRFPGVYAVGDVTSVGTPKAGVFAERAAHALADRLVARGARRPGAGRLRRHRRLLDRVRRRTRWAASMWTSSRRRDARPAPSRRRRPRRPRRRSPSAPTGARAGSRDPTRSPRAVASTPDLRHHVGTRGRRWSSLHEQLATLEVIGC